MGMTEGQARRADADALKDETREMEAPFTPLGPEFNGHQAGFSPATGRPMIRVRHHNTFRYFDAPYESIVRTPIEKGGPNEHDTFYLTATEHWDGTFEAGVLYKVIKLG